MKVSLRSSLAAVISAVAVAGVMAAPLQADVVRRLSPDQRAAVFAATKAQSASVGKSGADVTSPILTAISVPKQAMLTPLGQQVVVSLTVADDWSGLEWGSVGAVCDDAFARNEVAIPATFGGRTFSGSIALLFPSDLTACQWKISEVFGADANGNGYYYDAEQLAGFGDLSFKVSPLPTVDRVPPVLRAGKIMTSTVHLDRAAKGTDDHAPMARVELTVVDSADKGMSGVSGVRSAELLFCSDAPWGECFAVRMPQQDSIPYGSKEVTFLVGSMVDINLTAGDYVLKQVTLQDWLGNQNFYDTGNTNFRRLFGNTTITLRRLQS